jgi:hypothetical protein
VDHLFYSIEETPDRYFLMQVRRDSDRRRAFIWDVVSDPDPELILDRHDYSASGQVTDFGNRNHYNPMVQW